ncbi:MAG: sugar phosphate isomerase/epimerase [Candidatus Hydrogenedentes bacterium]|nr:sugar phosphate isomerase/epimerase [Candidatus Hydrogenedentota bacterium]
MTAKFSTGLWVFSSNPDRYCVEGYRDIPKVTEAVSLAAKIKGLKGVEVSQTDISSDLPVKDMKRLLKDNGLACSGVNTNLCHSRRFSLAGFGHQHQKTRNAAIDEGRKAADLARALGASEITLRLFTDGFDYPFQVDYTAHWNTVISSIKTIAKYASPDVNVAITYKPREPRKHLTVATVGKALSMCQEIAMKNVGVAMNFSHAMMSGENPAESVAFLTRSNKLFQMYFSDGYRLWDDAMIPGSINLWESMETLFYLKTAKYKGYLTIDMLPQRIEPTHALQIAIGNLSILYKKLEKLDTSELRRAQKTLDAMETQRIVRRVMLQ